MNYCTGTSNWATPAQLYFTGTTKWEPFIPKEVLVAKKRIFFKPKGKLSTLYEEGMLVAKLGNRVNIIEADETKYYVSVDFCHTGFSKETKLDVLDDWFNLLEKDNQAEKVVEPLGEKEISISLDCFLKKEVNDCGI
uniref:ASCH domain-containing protein n=1 Tax=Rhabditophanes sp. KR3021 TaxID=114890 RepID=A0AC35TVR7_9BILA